MVEQDHTDAADDTFLRNHAQFPTVIVLIGTVHDARDNHILDGVAWQGGTTADKETADRVIESDEIALFDLLTTDTAIIEEAAFLTSS